MIIGIGTDVVEIERMEKLLGSRLGERFLQRILTPEERELAQHKKSRLGEFAAGRFAAKEAVVKAIGCGIGEQVGFQDICIINGPSGRPLCRLTDSALERAGLRADMRIHLSISHSERVAVAFVVIESE